MKNNTHIPATTDRMTALIEVALQQARHAVRLLNDKVVPQMPSLKKSFILEMIRRIEHGKIFQENILRDIETLILQIAREAESGTYHVWEPDEHHDDGGRRVTRWDTRAKAFLAATDRLHHLHDAISMVVDLQQSYAIANNLATAG